MSLPVATPAVSPPRAAPASLLDVLERYWGYTTLPAAAARGDGRHAGPPRLAGRAADRRRQVALLPGAGAGRPTGVALVVSPLISLMKDQVDTLVGNGVPAACYNSSLSRDQQAGRDGRPARGPLPAALRVARAAGRRRRPTGSCAASPPAPRRCASSPSTRRTASASGATTSGPSTASSAGCASSSPASACTPSRPPPPRGCARDIAAQLGLRRPARAGRRRSTGRT